MSARFDPARFGLCTGGFIFLILFYIELAKAFGKSGGFAAGLIFPGFIFFPILGFGSSEYVYGSADPKAA